MMFFSTAPEPQSQTSWLAKIVGFLILGACIVALMRASVASVVSMHGTGMSPTLLEGDRVLLVRGNWGIRRGDIVVYSPLDDQVPPKKQNEVPRQESLPEELRSSPPHQPHQGSANEFKNVTIADLGELHQRWDALAISSDSNSHRLQVGRIIAVPGDKVTFQVPHAAMGLAINGVPLRQMGIEQPRTNDPKHHDSVAPSQNQQNPLATAEKPVPENQVYEWNGAVHYPILGDERPAAWPGIKLPQEQWPIEMRASGYLILADNRKDGDCCDGRSFGWVDAEQIRGEVSARIRRDLNVPNDHRWLGQQSIQWLP